MGKYILDENDYEQIESLIRITGAIEVLYTRLYELEINNKKDTPEYQQQLEYLSIVVRIEEDIYNKLKLTPEQYVAWMDYIKRNISKKSITEDFSSIIVTNHDDLVYKRILNILFCFFTAQRREIMEVIPQSIVYLFGEYGIHLPIDTYREKILNKLEVQEAIEFDILQIFLIFLQQCIMSSENNEIRNKLIRSKYNIIFINKDVDTRLYDELYKINQALVISESLAEYRNITKAIYKTLVDNMGQEITLAQITELLNIGNIWHDDEDINTTTILRQCLIKATFIFMSKDMIAKLNYQFHNIIESPEYLRENPERQISEEKIIRCFEYIKEFHQK